MTKDKRNKIRDYIKKLIPDYALKPFLVMLFFGCSTFWATPLLTSQMHHYTMEISLDAMIPFLPVFVVPYICAYLQWMIGYAKIARTERAFFLRIIYGELTAKVIVCMIFILFPTVMTRPVITGNDLFSQLVALLYKMDSPINLFPSIHCLESWICFRASLNRRYFSRKYAAIMGITTLLVCASTVCIKQHVIVDVIGGIVTAEIGLFLARFIKISSGDQVLQQGCSEAGK